MKKRIRVLNTAIAACIGLILLFLIIHVSIIYNENHRVHTVIGNDSSEAVYMDIDFRGDSTSRWQKRDYDLCGEPVDLTGTTIDEILYNNAGYALKDWSLRINITGDCFINQAWNGQMEIHQYVASGKEAVQLLNLQNYRLEDITLDFLYDGDLLIPLQAGDYVVYHPADSFGERTLEAGGKLTIGVIFYFTDSIDLSEYQLDYTYQRGFTQGFLFYAILLLCFLLFTAVVVACSTVATYRTARREQERQKSAVSCMSDIYQIIYLINIAADELIPVHADEAAEKLRPKQKGAREQLSLMFDWDAEENYRALMQEFSDPDTVGERLIDRNSIACEYISRHYGWCSVRIFAMDPVQGKVPEKILFTIQVIDEEKKELESVRARVSKAESDSVVQAAIRGRIFEEIREPLRGLADTGAELPALCGDPAARACAEKLSCGCALVLAVVDGILDYSALRTGALELSRERYSLRQITEETYRIAETAIAADGLRVKLQMPEGLHDALRGDGPRLKQTLLHLILHAVNCTEAGEITLKLYGKAVDDHLHLLFSVISEGTLRAERTKDNDSLREDMDLCIAADMIGRLDSRLKIVSGNEEIYELYFEIDQDPAE